MMSGNHTSEAIRLPNDVRLEMMKFWRKQAEPQDPCHEQVLARLPEPFRTQLLSMYAGQPQKGAKGKMFPIDSITRVWPVEGMYLYDLCRKVKPKKTLEIGLAYGFSTLYILAAHHENGVDGSHLAVDPCQGANYHEIGLNQPENVGMAQVFRFLERRSYPVLGELIARGECFEFIFIDGSHRFDDVLTDFTLTAELCPMEGCIVLDDFWMASIQRAVSFVRKNRKDFEELTTNTRYLTAFKRIAKDGRPWDFHVEF